MFSTQLMGVTLTKLDVIKLELGEFYLFDVKDEGLNIARAIDAYVIDDKTYIAITPILDSLRVKYRFVENNLEIEVFEQKKKFFFLRGWKYNLKIQSFGLMMEFILMYP
ncbi:hypothetical protein RT723_08075 [Psychrosphaera aquimarina]|uniref:Uncharacterized protein n=1 Tax=Psychrosphaera aquimarina TaxID=2044854 RepID=A0ABU3QZU2_9GAMM|nr:hypothetical protein [Psychrosphaera aquimarina]MDU0112952.1 hypothetical protein [Psychrosphaera aquimarina]